MIAIYKRELRAYFNSFMGWLFVGVLLFFLGLYFTVYGLIYGYPQFAYVVSSTVMLFLICVPILTMRILAEERRNKTDQLILTAPVSVSGIVLGKFLALVTIFAIPAGISCIYPLILTKFGTVPLAQCYLAVLAFFLYGVASIAIGVLVSALTESQVIAAALGFAVLFLGYMMNAICSLLTEGSLIVKILSLFDMYIPFVEMLNGTLKLDSVIYYLSIVVLCLFLTVQLIQKRRYSVSVKQISMGAYNTGMIAVVVAIIAIVNVIVGEMPSTWTTVDVTDQKLYSITDQTKDYVKGMTEDVTIYVVASEETCDTMVQETLKRYEDISDHIIVEYVDPTINPRFASQYTDENLYTNSLIVVSDKRSKVISYEDLYESTIDYTTYESSITGYDAEGQITSALDYVTSDDMPKMYMTEGHGEVGLTSAYESGIAKQNVDYETINLMEYDAVPEDAACLLINAPVSDFNSDDKDKVIEYLSGGGKVIAVIGYTDAALTNFEEILAYMGLTLADGMIVEQSSQNYYQSPYYLLPTVKYSTYTNGIYNKYYIFAPYARGIQIVDKEAEGMKYTTFLSTSDSAFSKVDLADAANMEKTEGDIEGPFDIGLQATKEVTTQNGDSVNALMLVIGCDQLFTDEASQMVSGANQMLFNNIVGSFADQEANSSIPVKSYESSYLMVSEVYIGAIGLVVTLILPISCLAAGFVIWYKRRRR